MAAYWKAILAALIACLGSLVTALDDNVLTWPEGITAAVALLVGLGTVIVVPNAGFVNLNKISAYSRPELGPVGFEAYSQAVGGRAVSGDPIPEWSRAPENVKEGWRRSADAVVSVLRHG